MDLAASLNGRDAFQVTTSEKLFLWPFPPKPPEGRFSLGTLSLRDTETYHLDCNSPTQRRKKKNKAKELNLRKIILEI